MMHVMIIRNLFLVMRKVSLPMAAGCFAVYLNILINGMVSRAFGSRPDATFTMLFALVFVSERLLQEVSQGEEKPALAGAGPARASTSIQVLRHANFTEEHKQAMWNMLSGRGRRGRPLEKRSATSRLEYYYDFLCGADAAFWIAARWFSDPLRIKKTPSAWLDHPDEAYDMEWRANSRELTERVQSKGV